MRREGEFNQPPEPPSDPEQYRQYLDRIFVKDHDLTGVEAAWLGLPTALGQPDKEPKDGPGYLRKLDAPNALKATGADILDAGDLAPTKATLSKRMLQLVKKDSKEPAVQDSEHGEVKNLDVIVEYSRQVMAKVQELLAADRKVVSVGGDHSFAFATIGGALEHFKGDLGVIWIDAHGDINIPRYKDKGSGTANAHGMPVAHLMGLEGTNPKLTELISSGNHLKPRNLIYIGLKDLDPEELAYLDSLGIQYFTVENSTEAHRDAICRKIDALQKQVGHIWCSADLDSIDMKAAPGTRMRNKGGLSRKMALSLAQYIGVTTKLAGFDIAEYAPELDDEDDKTAHVILELTARLLGGSKKRWDETAYLEGYKLKVSPRKKATRLKRVGKLGTIAATAAVAIHQGWLDRSKTPDEVALDSSKPSQEAVYDEWRAKAGLSVPKEGVNFLPNLDRTYVADLRKDAVKALSKGDFKQAAEGYKEATDTKSKDYALSQMLTYLHVALLKSVDQAEKNRVWKAVAKTVGEERANGLMGQYRAFQTGLDNKKIEDWLKAMEYLPPG